MRREDLETQFLNKIPKNAKAVIFGAYYGGSSMLEDIQKNRPDVKVLYFADNYKAGTLCNLKILNLKELVEKKSEIDVVIMASITAQYIVCNILDIYNIPFIATQKEVIEYYTRLHAVLDDEKLGLIKNIFKSKEDRDLYEMLYDARRNVLPLDKPRQYYANKYPEEYPTLIEAVKYQYLEKINKEKVSVAFDVGFCTGINAISFFKELPNLKKIHAFDVIYDYCKDPVVEQFFDNEKITIVDFAISDKIGKSKFMFVPEMAGASFTVGSRDLNSLPWKSQEMDVNNTTIDNYCAANNVCFDFIKMDIEGGELAALKGGIETIKKYRPQLAISIYHNDNDFVNIPIYLFDNLENYTFKLGHYSTHLGETVLYAIPEELC